MIAVPFKETTERDYRLFSFRWNCNSLGRESMGYAEARCHFLPSWVWGELEQHGMA